MSATGGYVTAALQLGFEAIRIKPKRGIAQFTAQATVEERHTDDLEITDHPVEKGAVISDHAYKRPAEVIIKCGWSDSPSASGLFGGLLSAVTGTIAGVSSLLTGNSPSQVKEVYAKLLALQESREPFTVYTGKRVYENMLFKSLTTTTDAKTEHSLMVTAVLRQIIIVQTQTVTIGAPAKDQANPEQTEATSGRGDKQLAPAPTFNSAQGTESLKPGV